MDNSHRKWPPLQPTLDFLGTSSATAATDLDHLHRTSHTLWACGKFRWKVVGDGIWGGTVLRSMPVYGFARSHASAR